MADVNMLKFWEHELHLQVKIIQLQFLETDFQRTGNIWHVENDLGGDEKVGSWYTAFP